MIHRRKQLSPCLFIWIIVLSGISEIMCGAAPTVIRIIAPDVPLGLNGATLLPNGWQLTPAGHSIPLPGDLPMGMIISPDSRYLLINTAGYHDHDLDVIDLSTNRLVQTLDIDKDWVGMSLDTQGKILYVSSGQGYDSAVIGKAHQDGMSPSRLASMQRSVLRFGFSNGRITAQRDVAIPELINKERYTAGLTTGPTGSLYVVDLEADTVYRLGGPNLVTLATAKVGYRPYAVALSPNGELLAVSNWGDQSVSLLDAQTLQERGHVKVGSHPNCVEWARDGRLFVANSGSNTVSVIARYRTMHRDGHGNPTVIGEGADVLETIQTSIHNNDLVGSTPDALAISSDCTRLYVANADNNDIEVVNIADLQRSHVLGFIPTAWYPSALALSPDGKKLYVGTGKGLRSRPNVPAILSNPRTTVEGFRKYDYIGNVMNGSLSVIDIPDVSKLAFYTSEVRANCPHPPAQMSSNTDFQAAASHIKHIVYIIRENRTYDQILGDMPGGMGDPSIAFFGRTVTPNAHSLADSFGLLDNLYCNGEVSEDGHKWCDDAYATDFTEKTWPSNYSNRDEPSADERLTSSPAGSLWDSCLHHGISYYSYGEAASYLSGTSAVPVFTGDPVLNGHSSAAWSSISFDRHDTDRAALFLADLYAAEVTGNWPQFVVMSLGEDHTQGLESGKYTPVAHIASNDLALGEIVEGISHSRFWNNTAIFVIEDDAQNGPDHIDCHRTVGFVISPYAKRHVVDSTMYSTASFVRTIELFLGLPAMTQFDSLATPLTTLFSTYPDLRPYTYLVPKVNLEARNVTSAVGTHSSALAP